VIKILIGVTGGIGSGKSTLCKAAEDLGYCVIDADKIGHDILLSGKPAYTEITGLFGKEILLQNGEIDRKKLGNIVFSNAEKLKLLNKITHEKIAKAIDDKIKKCKNKNIVLEGAVLFESGMNGMCDYVIAVIAPKDERINRVMQRDLTDERSVLLRMSRQKDDEYYTKRANLIITNNGDLSRLYNEGIKVFSEVANGKV